MTLELHGIEVKTLDQGLREVGTVSPSLVVVVGTAGKGAVNEPKFYTGDAGGAFEEFGPLQNDGFTIPESNDGIADQVASKVIFINVCDPATHKTALTAEVLAFNGALGKTIKPYVTLVDVKGTAIKLTKAFNSEDEIVLPTGIASVTSVKSASGDTYVEDTDYTVTDNIITRETGEGIDSLESVLVEYTATLVSGTDYTVDADTGVITITTGSKLTKNCSTTVDYTYVDPTKVTNSDVIGSITGNVHTGLQGILTVQSTFKEAPVGILAPYFDSVKVDANTKNAVAAELQVIKQKTGARVFLDAGDGTYAEFLDYMEDFSDDDVEITYPHVKAQVGDVIKTQPMNIRYAGAVARGILENGFYQPVSSQKLYGVLGLSQPIDFQINDKTSKANLINQAYGITAVNHDGFKVWGLRASSGKFVSRNATDRFFNLAVQDALMWALDRNITKNLIGEVVNRVQFVIDDLVNLGAIQRGTARADKTLNTDSSLAQGKLYIDVEYTGTTPLEHAIVRVRLDNEYIASLFN